VLYFFIIIFVVVDEFLVKNNTLYRNISFVLTGNIVFLVLYREFVLESFRYGDELFLRLVINVLVVLCNKIL